MATTADVTERLQDGVEVNAVDCSEEPFALQSLCMNCYENVRKLLNLVHMAALSFCCCMSS